MLFLIKFFTANAFRSKRVILTGALALVPVLLAAALLVVPRLTGGELDGQSTFLQMGLLLHLYILLPLFAALVGSGAVADEVEERTLPYIITRPVAKWRFAVSKIVAGFVVTGMILIVSLWMTYTVLVGPSGDWTSGLVTLLRVTGVLLIGSLVYVSLFALLGAAVKRPVLYGLIFAFGWEKIVAHLPMRLKYFTVVKYLNDLYPAYRGEGTGLEQVMDEALEQLFRGGSSSMLASILSLILICVCCAGLTALLLYVKEYRLEQE